MRLSAPFLLVLLAACVTEPAPRHAPAEPSDAAVRAAAWEQVRALWPGLEGPLTRESLERAVLAERSARLPAELRAVEEALLRDDLEGAHEALGALVLERSLARARRLVEERPREGLALLERARALAPTDARVRELHGEASLAVGLAEEDPAALEAALASLREAAELGGGAKAWVGASRAARALGRAQQALELAGRALAPSAAIEASVALGAQRALCEASLDLLLEGLPPGGAGEPQDAALLEARFERAERALREYVARAPRDAWGHERLALVHELHGELDAAREALLEGVRAQPEDLRLHERLIELARRGGERPAVLATYERLREALPSSAATLFFATRERFDGELEREDGGECARFEPLERDFARSRRLDARWSRRALELEVLCRVATGWCLLERGELARAHEAFLAADDLERGRALLLELPGRLASGVRGLAAVAEASNDSFQSDPNSLERAAHVERACKVFDFLHAYQPDSLDWARAAGFFDRDAAVLLEQRARALEARGEREQATQLLARARETMERSYRAWVDACELAPDDLRMHADAARVLVLYLQRDVAEGERLLRRAIALGEEQLPAARARLAEAAPEQRAALAKELEALEIAFGDACETLGVLHLTLKSDPRAARPWFQRALAEGGPDPRPSIDGRSGEGASTWPDPWLERCARAEAGGGERALARWAAPAPRPSDPSR